MSVRKLKEKLDQAQKVVTMLYQEVEFLKELSVGTFETMKLLPGYDEALEKLKENLKKNEESKEKLPT
jgi:FtsZ-binding cell division protein ZapB|tara:strand:- start:82 stop:285 length:204 start_codon:yes stop_codon:yes gene_type:complete